MISIFKNIFNIEKKPTKISRPRKSKKLREDEKWANEFVQNIVNNPNYLEETLLKKNINDKKKSLKKNIIDEFYELKNQKPVIFKKENIFKISIPKRKKAKCICGCRGKKLHYEIDIDEIEIYSYNQCPARFSRKYNEQIEKLLLKQKELDRWSEREKNNSPARSREEAKNRGLKTFIGKKCVHCSSNIKDYRFACVPCSKAKNSLRKAMKRGAYPEDLTKEEQNQILQIYEECRLKTKKTGIEYHVDHIKPLARGGRHHPSNLRIITAKENLKKGAKWNE